MILGMLEMSQVQVTGASLQMDLQVGRRHWRVLMGSLVHQRDWMTPVEELQRDWKASRLLRRRLASKVRQKESTEACRTGSPISVEWNRG